MSDTVDMFEPDAHANAGVFDHEEHAPGALLAEPGRRRRREIADWGVGEDVFDRLPARRFARDDDDPPSARARAEAPKSGDTGSWLAERERAGRAAASRSAAAADAGVRVMPVDAERFTVAEAAPPTPAGSVPGRRTIVIGTRHDEVLAPQHQSPRRRPPRTAAERVGHRPDRIVGWMVAMGILLIVIAILSAGH